MELSYKVYNFTEDQDLKIKLGYNPFKQVLKIIYLFGAESQHVTRCGMFLQPIYCFWQPNDYLCAMVESSESLPSNQREQLDVERRSQRRLECSV